ncbi:MAG: SGNH/GDSL hydrolase family protein [Bdellovibrionota bacterium]
MRVLNIFFINIFIVLSFFTNSLYACDETNLSTCFVDRNKDKKIRILFIGDSFVRGVGDVNNKGGYTTKLNNDFRANTKRKVRITKIARPGATVAQILSHIKQNIYKNPTMLRKIYNADAIILDMGRNDFWDRRNRNNVRRSITTLRRLIKFLRTESGAKVKPFITVSTLAHVSTKKPKQLNFIKSFNTELLKYPKISGIILQHQLPTTILSEDGLHPSPLGHNYIYSQVRTQMLTTLYNKMK